MPLVEDVEGREALEALLAARVRALTAEIPADVGFCLVLFDAKSNTSAAYRGVPDLDAVIRFLRRNRAVEQRKLTRGQ